MPCQMSVCVHAQFCVKKTNAEQVYVILQMKRLQLWLYGTWSVADVGHGAAFGGDVAQVDLLGLDLDLRGSSEKAHMSTCSPEKA